MTAPLTRACSICCSTTEELRPYGQQGADICFDCMVADPVREAEAKKNFITLLEAATIHGVAVIGSEDGPRPFDPSEVRP